MEKKRLRNLNDVMGLWIDAKHMAEEVRVPVGRAAGWRQARRLPADAVLPVLKVVHRRGHVYVSAEDLLHWNPLTKPTRARLAAKRRTHA